MKPLLQGAEERLIHRAKEVLGEEWYEKGLLNVPSCTDEKSRKGFHLGHVLWIYNVLYAYGMYDFAKARFSNLESGTYKWNDKKSFEENIKPMSDGNPGRLFDDSCDLASILSDHYNPGTAIEKMKEIRDLLSKKSTITKQERKEKGWDEAYDLRPWNEFPDIGTVMSNPIWVLIQNNSVGKYFYSGGGPTTETI